MKLINPIMQGAKGKMGNTVFRDGGNGTVIGSAYQPNVKNPRTEAQQGNRNKMRAIGSLSKALANFLREAYEATQRPGRCRVYPHNQFVKDNIGSINISGEVSYKELKVSKGRLQKIEAPTQTSTPLGPNADPKLHDIEFDFTFNANALNASPNDIIFLLSINNNTKEVMIYENNVRSTGECKERTGRNPKTGESLHYYSMAINQVTGIVSDSFYIGSVDEYGVVTYNI